MTQAEFNATLRVAYEEINASMLNYSLQPTINSVKRQFLNLRPASQQDTVPPHQLLRVVFKGYSEDGSARITSSTENLSREIKVGEKKDAAGKVTDVMKTVTAKVLIFKKTKSGRSSTMLTITDAANQAVLKNENIEGRSNWTYEWATYTGDIQALNQTHQNLVKMKEVSPNDRDLYQQAMRNLESNLERTLREFYSQY
jgi:hypothetical protein